jgi:hypothetical protein
MKEQENGVHNEELHNLYSSPNSSRQIKSRRMRWEGRGGEERRGEERKVYRPIRRWENGITMVLVDTG